ncbi:hypothetical protein EXIGLDRAFT_651999 [Exidia glandulosa HHB12029]|uniref:Uncharacterized protein n=1 Tax=Exidia glandulosa HHB12029 TaxID=1314781 RepID=A0A165ET25_EXIGL|nr:hypothetical protein EXIGLDRAFT_651999 [Exidia glandulosa HHB12029]
MSREHGLGAERAGCHAPVIPSAPEDNRRVHDVRKGEYDACFTRREQCLILYFTLGLSFAPAAAAAAADRRPPRLASRPMLCHSPTCSVVQPHARLLRSKLLRLAKSRLVEGGCMAAPAVDRSRSLSPRVDRSPYVYAHRIRLALPQVLVVAHTAQIGIT